MSEQTKLVSKSLSERVQSYFKMKELLEAKYDALMQEVAEAKAIGLDVTGVIYVAPKMELDEPALLTQYLLEHPTAESLYMTIEERKLHNKRAEDELIKDACGWFTMNNVEMPKKPRKGYLKLNTKGIKEDNLNE